MTRYGIFVLGLLILIYILADNAISGRVPDVLSPAAIAACHDSRVARIANEGWGDPTTYRMADKIGQQI